MGQLVSVREKHSSTPGIVRYEINRSLTGMGHERYSSPDDIVLDRPVDAVARRLFDHGGIDDVHVNSSVITVRLSGGSTGEGIAEVIEHLFKFYDEDEADGAEAPVVEADAAAGADDAVEDGVSVAEESDAGVDAGEPDGDVPEA